ncbi:MAG TPA: IS30 family transposase [Steroidobacteraceae bacterium]|nr:IS30 family transposase [Steroidobacteraceae bacterium]
MSRGLSPQEKAELWQRWKAGETVAQIARTMGKHQLALFRVVRPSGGIAPRERCRSRLALTLAEREEISRGLCARRSMRQIARVLGRAPSSVSREIARNTPQWWHYRAHAADQRAWDKALRPKPCHLTEHPQLAKLVAQKLRLEWSPQQIAGWLAREYGDAKSRRVSHETIYRSLFIQARGVLKKQLAAHLRRGRTLRRSRQYVNQGPGRGEIPEAVSIRERPAQAEDRAVPGHWEGDLLLGRGHTRIATLVERKSRFVILVKLPSGDTHTVVRALTRRVRKLPKQLRRSLTWDRGTEMTRHKEFSLATDVKVYFCDPHSPWQRGSNENTNGLLRQYFPKKTDLSVHSQAHLDRIALRLNQRPRETLGFSTPADTLSAYVASTG